VFTSLIRKYAETVVRFRWIVLGLTLAFTFVLGSRIKGLRLDNDPDLWTSALLSLILLRAVIALIKPKFIVGPRNRPPGEPVFPAAEGV
jgi:hypothetical protein